MSGRLISISPTGIVVEIHTKPKKGESSLPYEECRQMVGGFLERVQVRFEGRVRDAYVDEDGISKGLMKNVFATVKLTELWKGNTLYGPCVVWVPDPKVKK
jgi:hypothetical protein